MSYYKVTYESDTLDGLKTVQALSSAQSGSSTDASGSAGLANMTPPPQQEDANGDAFAGAVQAPPNADNSGASSGYDEQVSFSPPPIAEDSVAHGSGDETWCAPPPKMK